MKPLAIALSGGRKSSEEGRLRSDLINVHYKPIQNCQNESPLYNGYILIKMKKRIISSSNRDYLPSFFSICCF
jgi:hypothetical protein